jgi:streptogramin lyase
MRRPRLTASVRAMVAVVIALGLAPGESAADRTVPSLRLPSRSIFVATPKFFAGPVRGLGKAVLEVTLESVGSRPLAVAPSDFTLSAAGDMFGPQRWNARRSRITIAPGHSRALRLTFRVPSRVARQGRLFYRPTRGGESGAVPLDRSAAFADPPAPSIAERFVIHTVRLTLGVGDPWGTAVDGSGNVWFAESGCDFAPTCAANTPPGQIGRVDSASGTVTYYTLPDVPGNQPIFVAFDGAGNLWFTTPNNSMIGEFSPSTGRFIGQWPVTAGSGPWDLTVTNGQIWYTEHLASAVGRFDTATHAHRDFQTPSANSNPYGITASGGLIWFTENNSTVDRVAVLDTADPDVISEYPIVQPLSGTPHMIVVDASGRPWWTEGFSNTIATLNPAVATPGGCGTTSGTCTGIRRFDVPPSSTCGESAHTSGIAFQSSAGLVWFDNSLTAQVGSFAPSTNNFGMNTLSDCGAHPHDGLSLGPAGNVWFDEEFANAIGELVPAGGSANTGATSTPATPAVTAEVGPLPPANSSEPMILGSPTQAQALTATNGSWTNNPTGFSYQWQRCDAGCTNITGATGDAYTLTRDDVDANVRMIVTASNAVGSAQAASGEFGPVGPSLERVRAAISSVLSASGAATITRLLKNAGYSLDFDAPSAGNLTIAWSVVAKKVHKPRRLLLAAARRPFAKAGGGKLKIRLSRIGKRLLKRSNKRTVTATVTFIPLGEAAVTMRKRFTLSARRRAGRAQAVRR